MRRRRMMKMNKEVVEYMENKIKNGPPEKVSFDKTLLGLYEKGFVDISMVDGEPLIKISKEGTDVYMSEVALSFADMAEA
jgi:hypothetical protein